MYEHLELGDFEPLRRRSKPISDNGRTTAPPTPTDTGATRRGHPALAAAHGPVRLRSERAVKFRTLESRVLKWRMLFIAKRSHSMAQGGGTSLGNVVCHRHRIHWGPPHPARSPRVLVGVPFPAANGSYATSTFAAATKSRVLFAESPPPETRRRHLPLLATTERS